jgi:hypothetical protein
MHPTSRGSLTSRLGWNLGMMGSMQLISHTLSWLPPPSPSAAATDPSAAATGPSIAAHAPPAAHVSPYAPETSRATTHRDKHGNIFIKGLKTLISMCQSNDVVVHESHQQMSNMLSRMEERKHEMRTHLELENPEPFVYPDLPPPAVAGPWAWYCNADDDEADDEIQEEFE